MSGLIITEVILTNGTVLPLTLDGVSDPENATETARNNINWDGGIEGVANSTGALVFVPSASVLFVASYYEEPETNPCSEIPPAPLSPSGREEIPLPKEPYYPPWA